MLTIVPWKTKNSRQLIAERFLESAGGLII